MSKTIISFFVLLFSLLISLSSEECQVDKNNCKKCHPVTNLCVLCENSVYEPDEEGGCKPIKKCTLGDNYCNKCNNNNDLCLQCEAGYFADEIGGCSSTDNCIVSENGKCLKCKDDFYLIEKYDLSFCKYQFSDDFKNCVEINSNTGKCNLCEENFYLSSDDKKCTNTDSCKKSTLGICTQCEKGFYLDKTDDLCKTGGKEFNYCKISLDGKICNECNDGFFFTEEGYCSASQYCAKRNTFNEYCMKCSEGYYLTKSGSICTNEINCDYGDFDFHICEFCEESFYLELETRKCFSNLEDEKLKFCSTVSLGNCIDCESGYNLGKDNKCSTSLNCIESENGICKKCEEGYHLGLDNNCINIEKCIYSSTLGLCIECENNYYYDENENKCILGINQYKNCKKSYPYDNYCEKCKDDYYLLLTDRICYNNNEEGPLYKCAISNDGTECSKCINNYYLDDKDLKCSKIENCAISENENKCIECHEYFCLNVKKQTCEFAYSAPENEEEMIYFNCIKTNEEGNECEICNNSTELVNGICVNKIECAEEKDGKCIKCNEISYSNYNMCLNSVFGCVETWVPYCLRCDNKFNFDECTECMEGYELDENGKCNAKIVY